MAVAGSLAYQLTLDAKGYVSGIQSADGGTRKFIASMKAAMGMAAGFGAALAGFRGIRGLMREIFNPFEEGFRLRNLSKQTNETIETLFRFEWGLKAVGVNTEQAGVLLTRFQRAIGGVNAEGKPTAYTFAMMGLNIRNLQKMETWRAFDMWSSKLKDLNRYSAAYVATSIMGGARYGGGQILALARSIDDMREAMRRAGVQARIFDTFGYTFYQIIRRITLIRDTLKGFFVGLAGGAGGGLLYLLRQFDQFLARNQQRIVDIGMSIGKVFGVLAAAFQEGKLFELIKDAFKAAFEAAGNFLMSVLGGVFSWAENIVSNILSKTVTQLQEGLEDGLYMVFAKFYDLLAEAQANLLMAPALLKEKSRGLMLDAALKAFTGKTDSSIFSGGIQAFLKGFKESAGYFGTQNQDMFKRLYDFLESLSRRFVETEKGPSPGDVGSRLGGIAHLTPTNIEKMGFSFRGGVIRGAEDFARQTALNTYKAAVGITHTNQLLSGHLGGGGLGSTHSFAN